MGSDYCPTHSDCCLVCARIVVDGADWCHACQALIRTLVRHAFIARDSDLPPRISKALASLVVQAMGSVRRGDNDPPRPPVEYADAQLVQVVVTDLVDLDRAHTLSKGD